MSLELGIYLVTDRGLCARGGAGTVVDTVKAAVDNGVTTVQIRDKEASFDQLLTHVADIADVINGRALLLVNDRVDVVAEGRSQGITVDGVHLGQSDTDPRIARERLGQDALIGLTANAPEHLTKLSSWPHGTVDYLGVGVIHPTATKTDHPPELGIDGFARFVEQAAPIPCVGIGGVTRADVPGLVRAGAAGAAVVSAICAAEDPEQASREFVTSWNVARS